MYRILLLVTCCFLWTVAPAQVKPAEGDILNYRMVGFVIPQENKTIKYSFEVSEYTIEDQKETFYNTIIQASDSNSTVILLPEFGKQYAWRVKYINRKGKITGTTQYYHFSIGKSKYVDTAQYKLHVIDSAIEHNDMYIITDYIPVIYNLKGEPIWYLPDVENMPDLGIQLRDVKPHNKTKTFTAIANHDAVEFDFRGKIMWRGPDDGRVSGDTSEHYHHELIKMPNGNNMVASHQRIVRKVPQNIKIDTTKYVDITKDTTGDGNYEKRQDGYYKKLTLGNLIEYDPMTNEVIWSWKSIDHFSDQDLFTYTSGMSGTMLVDMHLNSFYFDSTESVIYMSFRNTSEVIKIAYPSGKILKRFGPIWSDTGDSTGNRLFYGQHCVQKTSDNQIVLFNNNTKGRTRRSDTGAIYLESFVSMYRETNTKTGMEETWKYSCDIDTFTTGGTGVGGGVIPMPDGCFLACVGGAGRIFIVNRNKKLIWNAVTKTVDIQGTWYVSALYRAYYITQKELTEFIFN